MSVLFGYNHVDFVERLRSRSRCGPLNESKELRSGERARVILSISGGRSRMIHHQADFPSQHFWQGVLRSRVE